MVLNTIAAESLDYVATELENATGGDPKKLNAAAQKIVGELWKAHKAVVFNGDGYSAEWHAEAEKRGLPNMKNTFAALPSLIAEKNIKLFEKYSVLSEREIRSRYEIYVERYCKDVNMEALTALSMAKTMILPAVYRYQSELADNVAALKSAGKSPRTTSLDLVTGLCEQLEDKIAALETAMNHHGASDLLAEAKHFDHVVLPAMKAVREVADKLEMLVSDDLWPLPTYREMLFIK